MNSNFDHKADSLLRGFARSESSAAARLSDGETQSGNVAGDTLAHLDADDLNLYAENVLPAAARARYTVHLAACDRCRASLTALALAPDSVVAATAEDKIAVQPFASRDWRKHFARLFSQPVLRFGVPAFALLLVCVAAFFLTRTDRRDDSLIALREQREEPALNMPTAPENANTGTTAANTAPPAANRDSATTNTNSAQTQIASPQDSPPDNETIARNDKESKSRPQTQPNSVPTAAAPPPPPPAAQRPTTSTELAEAARRPASAPPTSNSVEESVSVAGAADVARSGSNTNESRQNPASSGEGVNAQRATQSDAANRASAAPTAAEKERNALRQRRGRATPPTSEDRSDDQIRVAETRTVAGRRFRRQNNVWIDADYNSSMSTINITRNSEQFRALAADEPALRRIANELGGEIIVRLNNRAYRIR